MLVRRSWPVGRHQFDLYSDVEGESRDPHRAAGMTSTFADDPDEQVRAAVDHGGRQKEVGRHVGHCEDRDDRLDAIEVALLPLGRGENREAGGSCGGLTFLAVEETSDLCANDAASVVGTVAPTWTMSSTARRRPRTCPSERTPCGALVPVRRVARGPSDRRSGAAGSEVLTTYHRW